MTRPRSPAIHCLLLLGALGLGCDEPAKTPAPATPPATEPTPADPTTPKQPESPASGEGADAAGMKLIAFDVAQLQQLTPVAVTAAVKLTRDPDPHTRVVLKAACQLGDATYVEVVEDLVIGDDAKRDAKIELEERFFGRRLYREGDPLGDCDFWLSGRVVVPDTGGQFREYLLDTRCTRGGKLLDQGCAPMPTATAPKPLTPSSVSISITSATVTPSTKTDSGHLLDFVAEVTGKEAVAPRWDLEGDIKCQGGGKTTHRHDRLLGTDVQELSPGQKARNDISSYAAPEETLDVPPTQCEIAITGTRRRDDPAVQLGTWCYTADEAVRVGACAVEG